MAATYFRKRIIGTPIDADPLPEEDDLDASIALGLQLDPRIREEGEELFEHFFMDQVAHDDDIKPDLRLMLAPRSPTPMSKTDVKDAAMRLVEIAANFADTEERKKIKETADLVGKNMTSADLANLLISMISESHHLEEGIVVLFYFCFDLALKMLEANYGAYFEILALCKEGLVTALGPKIQAKGGWAKVVGNAAKSSAMLGMAATGLFLMARVGIAALILL